MFIYQNLPELEPCQDPSEISCQDPRSHAKSRDLMCQEPRSYAKSRDFMPRRRDTNRDWRKSRDFFPRPKYYGSKGRNFIPPVRGEKKGRRTKMSGIQPQLAERESRTAGKSQVRPNPATHGQSESETSVSPRREQGGTKRPTRESKVFEISERHSYI